MKNHLQTSTDIFPALTGGAEQMTNDLNVELLGSLPLDPLLTRCCDEGKNVFMEMPDSPTLSMFNTILQSKEKENTNNKTQIDRS